MSSERPETGELYTAFQIRTGELDKHLDDLEAALKARREAIELENACAVCGHAKGAHGNVRWFGGEIEFRCTAREEPGGSFAGPCGCEGPK